MLQDVLLFTKGFVVLLLKKLTAEARLETLVGLATLMNLLTMQEGELVDKDGNTVAITDVEKLYGEQILNGTLIRKVEKNFFDVDATAGHQRMNLKNGASADFSN